MSGDLFGGLPVPLADQVAELERELQQRARVYPRLVGKGQLTQDRADLQTARLEAALATLQQAVVPGRGC